MPTDKKINQKTTNTVSFISRKKEITIYKKLKKDADIDLENTYRKKYALTKINSKWNEKNFYEDFADIDLDISDPERGKKKPWIRITK